MVNDIKKYTILYIVMAVTVGLSLFTARLPLEFDIYSLALYLSAIAGYGGITLMLWSYVLGTRSVSSLLSDDFLKITRIHVQLSKYGALLVLFHPLLVAYSYSETLVYALMPDFTSQFENAVTYGRAAIIILVVIWLSSIIFKSKISRRPWKYIHLGAYLAIPFALIHIPQSGSSYAELTYTKLYFFAVLIGFVIFSIIRIRGALNLNKTRYRIISQQLTADDIYTLRMEPIDNEKIRLKPGQYLYVKYGWFSEDHPFSVLAYDKTTGQIELCYKVYGKFTKRLSSLGKDERLFITGPFGNFTKNIGNKPTVFIAAGVGVVPFVQHIINESGKREHWLFFSNKTCGSAPMIETLRKALGDHLVAFYTREKTAPNPTDETCRINSDVIRKHLENPAKYYYYVCGPKDMIRDTSNILIGMGIGKQNIKSEAFDF